MVAMYSLVWAPLAAMSLFPFGSAAVSDECCLNNVDTPKFYKGVANKWLKLWNGDLSLLDDTVASDMVLHSDRFPSASGKGSDFIHVSSSKEFRAFIQRSRFGWDQYKFSVLASAASENHLAIRWRMHGNVGKDLNTTLPITKKPGDRITFDGTDFLFLDECTGLVKRYDLVQNVIDEFHQLGIEQTNV